MTQPVKLIAATLCLFLACLQLKAEQSTKTIEKTFPREGIEELSLSNTSGKMEITQTDGDEITVVVTMKVIAKTGVKADETLEGIRLNETRAGNYLNLETQLAKNMQLKQFLTTTNVSVDYVVSVPRGIRLRLVSTDGSIFLGNFAGDLNVDVRNGDFKAATLSGGELYVKQSGGTFAVEDVAWINGDFKDCKIRIEDATEAILTTSSCDGKIETCEKIGIRSSGGVLKLGEIGELAGSSSFTKYEVQDIAHVLDMDMKFGEMNIRHIRRTFSEIRLKGSFTKAGLTFASDGGYHLELKRNKSLKPDLPRGMVLEERPAAERNMFIGTKFVGNTNYSGKVFLELSNGSLYIQ